MRPQASLQTLAPLLMKSHFTSSEVKALGISTANICYYVKIGKIKRIRRGVYQSANYINKNSSLWTDLIETTSSIPGAVICLISALTIYNLTEEIPRQHWLAIRHETSIKSSSQINITRYRNFDLGKIAIVLEGVAVAIFDKERTIIDSFRLLSREIAIKALKAAVAMGGEDRIDFVKLEFYAKTLRFNIQPYLEAITT